MQLLALVVSCATPVEAPSGGIGGDEASSLCEGPCRTSVRGRLADAPMDERTLISSAIDGCMEDCVAELTGRPASCAASLAEGFGWDGGCNERECVTAAFRPCPAPEQPCACEEGTDE